MKAKDYYEKYKGRLLSDETEAVKAVTDLLRDFALETNELVKNRNVKIDRGFVSVIKEMNGKWNAIVRLFEKEYGYSPVLHDGYQKYMIYKIPELEKHILRREEK